MFYLIADEEDLAKEMPGTSHEEVLRLLEEMNKMENGVSTSDKKTENTHAAEILQGLKICLINLTNQKTKIMMLLKKT